MLSMLGAAAPRAAAESWTMRRERYGRWFAEPGTFFFLAEDGGAPIGYAFVTIGSAYACWTTGRVADLQTLSVLPQRRDGGVGARLLEAVWDELAERGVNDLALTTVATNIDSHRFYERHGFKQAFVVYHGHR
jgi:GNAT superfamily N-acetyltransferase